MKKTNTWFSVDKEGLRKLQEGKEKTFILRELVQNAWDEDIKVCDVTIQTNGSKIELTITDDSPEGFRDITHAYTLFADTYKRKDPKKRGRFNIGEKQAFAMCDRIELMTTKGTVIFDRTGRHESRRKRESGTIIKLEIKGTASERNQMIEYAESLLVPEGIEFRINGMTIESKKPIRDKSVKLATEIEENGIFKRTARQTKLEIYEKNEKAYLYEMGLPICEIECKFSVNIQQKIPLGIDRETVSTAYLQDVFAEVLNMTHDLIDEDGASDIWVREATSDERIEKDALKNVLKKRFGEKVVVANQFDPHSIDEAISNGYKVVTGSELSKEEWANIKNAELIRSSSDVFGSNTVNAPSVKPTSDMEKVADYAKRIAKKILGINISVDFVKHNQMVTAQYNSGMHILTFNTAKLGKWFWANPISAETTDLIIHELGHHGGHHTESGYHKTLTKLGAELTMLALEDPSFFRSS